jgi:colanic acid/amylovoran biosynthesis glycosyltransferase
MSGRLVTSFHGRDAGTYPRRWGSTVYRHLFDRGDVFTANSRYLRGRLLELGCPENRCAIVSEGLRVEDYLFVPRRTPPRDDFRFLTVARLVPIKGLEYAIAAFRRVTEVFPRAHYAIVGDGAERVRLQGLIDGLGLDERVTLLGPRTEAEVREIARSMHIFVLPSVTLASDQEGQGLVLQEAQAMGLPVIATRTGGVPEGLLDGVSGYLVPERDVAALANRMIDLCRRSEDWARMGRAGSDFVRQKFDQRTLMTRLLDVYERALTDDPLPHARLSVDQGNPS